MKKFLIILGVFVICLSAFGVIRSANERAVERYREIAQAYLRVNSAFNLIMDVDIISNPELAWRHRPLPEFGICGRQYLFLLMHEKETGVVLDVETVIDYFSQEFEPDGSLRLYNNGNHPEIQAFVEWMQEERPGSTHAGFRNFTTSLRIIYSDNFDSISQQFSDHNLSFYSELRDLPLDVLEHIWGLLTSSQQAGY